MYFSVKKYYTRVNAKPWQSCIGKESTSRMLTLDYIKEHINEIERYEVFDSYFYEEC